MTAMRAAIMSFLLAACCALSPQPALAQLTREAQAFHNFETTLEAAATAPDFVGLAVTVVRKGKPVFTRTFGVREAGKPDPVTPDTVFRLASLSKGFAATLAGLEIQDGRFSLTDRIADTVPQFRLRTPADTNAVTVEHILSHRVGLPPFAYDNLLEAGAAPLDILKKYVDVKLVCPVGACFGYQNETYNMIAAVIEQATGKSYAERIKERIFDPLDMKTASTGLSGLTSTGNWARPHIRPLDAWTPVAVRNDYFQLPAAAGVNASINDMQKWLMAQLGLRPDVISHAVLADLRKPRVPTPAETRRQHSQKLPVTRTDYGLGWRTMTYAGRQVVTHSGSVEGYVAYIAFLPDRKSGIVILSNTRAARASKLIPTWLDAELGLPAQDWLQLAPLQEAEVVASDESATTQGR